MLGGVDTHCCSPCVRKMTTDDRHSPLWHSRNCLLVAGAIFPIGSRITAFVPYSCDGSIPIRRRAESASFVRSQESASATMSKVRTRKGEHVPATIESAAEAPPDGREPADAIGLVELRPDLYLNRELSWLQF